MLVNRVSHKDIDKHKWDQCVFFAANRLIYAQSFYLDRMSPGWDALVYGDYEAVMPLCHRKKWGIVYLYQPAFCQQGGIFGKYGADKELTGLFVHALQKHFSFAEITLNFGNRIEKTEGVDVKMKMNFLLDLSPDHPIIRKKYSSSFIRILKAIRHSGYCYEKGDSPEEIIKLYRSLYGRKQPEISNSDYRNFMKICEFMQKQNDLIIRNTRNKKGILLASILLLKEGNRIYNLMSCLTAEGRKAAGNYFLYDQLIKEFSGKPGMLLDFEGSDVPGIADFYRRFRPEEEHYHFVRFNNLPRPFRWLKG